MDCIVSQRDLRGGTLGAIPTYPKATARPEGIKYRSALVVGHPIVVLSLPQCSSVRRRRNDLSVPCVPHLTDSEKKFITCIGDVISMGVPILRSIE